MHMRSTATAQLTMGEAGYGLRGFVQRQVTRLSGLAILAVCAFSLASLATWNVADPSFSHATDNVVTNAMGYPGAVIADILMQFLGLGSVVALVPAAAWALFLVMARGIDRKPARAGAWIAGAALGAGVVGCVTAPSTWPLPAGLGGVIGDLVLTVPSWLAGGYPTGAAAILTTAVLIGPTLWLIAFASGLLGRHATTITAAPGRKQARPVEPEDNGYDEYADEDEDDDRPGFMVATMGAATHWWLSARAFARRRLAAMPQRHANEWDDEDDFPAPRISAQSGSRQMAHSGRIEPGFSNPAPSIDDEPPFDVAPAPFDADAVYDEDDIETEEDDIIIRPTPQQPVAQVRQFRSDAASRVEAPAPRPQQGVRIQREAYRSGEPQAMMELVLPSASSFAPPATSLRAPITSVVLA